MLKKFQQKQKGIFIVTLLGLAFCFGETAQAAKGLQIGGLSSVWNGGENAIYTNFPSGASATSSFLKFQKNSVDILDINSLGNLSLNGNANFSGNIGVGTINPKTKLQISADNTGVTSRGTFSLVKNEEDYGLFAGVSGNGDTWMQTRAGGSATYYNLLLNPNGGNVGIGTASPDYKLDITGAARIEGNNVLGFGGTGASDREWYIQNDTSNNLNFAESGVSGGRLYLQSGGNVGIGTTSPAAKLDIYGTSNGLRLSYDSSNYLSISVASTGYTSFSALGSGSGFAFDKQVNANYAGNSLRVAGDIYFNNGSKGLTNASGDLKIFPIGNTVFTSGNVGISTTTPAYLLDVNGSPRFRNWAYGLTPGGTDLAALTTVEYVNSMLSSTTVGAWTKNGNDIFNNNIGNVGIGITNPTSLLHVQGNYSGGVDNLIPQMKIVNSATTSSYAFIKTMVGTGYVGGYPEIWMQAGGSTVDIRGVGNHDMRFWTNNAEKMRLTKDGNVGIGTTTPIDILAVYGVNKDTKLNLGGSGSFDEMISFANSSANNTWTIGRRNTASSLEIGYQTGTTIGSVRSGQLISVLTNGNVGISTTTPAYLLDVNGSPRFGNWAYGLTPGSTDLAALTTVEYVNGMLTSSTVWTKSGDNISNNNIGNVGIGTTTPGYKLDVAGDINLTGGIFVNGAPYVASKWSSNGSNIFYNAGNVGIGTGNPGTALHVQSNDGAVAFFNSRLNGGVYAGYLGNGQTNSAEEFGLYYASNDARLAVYDQANSLLLYGNSLAIDTGSNNVGIGTTNPGTLLDVLTATGDSYIRSLASTSDQSVGLSLGRGALSQWYLYSPANTTDFRISGLNVTDPFTIQNTTGNVGIGTSSPTYGLTVSPSTNNKTALFLDANSTKVIVKGGSNQASNNLMEWQDLNGNIGAYVNQSGNFRSASIAGTGGTNPSLITLGNGVSISTGVASNVPLIVNNSAGATADLFRLQSGGSSLFVVNNTGKVGIGSSTPNTATLVIATSTTNYSIDAGNYRVGNVASPVNNLDAANKSYVDSIVVATTTQGTQFGPWTVGVSNSIYNNNTGNIGIGTTTPSDKLGIIGNIGLSPASLIGSGFGYTGAAGGTASYATLQLYSNTNGYTTLNNQGFGIKLQTAGADRFTILNNGNVGIGMANPVAQLQVENSSGSNILRLSKTSAASYTWAINSGSSLALETNYFVVGGTGNVGIGTTNPGSRLDVFTPANDAYLRSLASSSDQSVGLAIGRGSLSQWYLYSPASTTDFRIHSYNVTDPLTIKGVTGNVGIGTTNPSYKLSVFNADGAGSTLTGSTLYLQSNAGATANKGGSVLFGDTGAPRAMVKGMYMGPTSGGALVFSTAADSGATMTERMRIDGIGNVGIGTSAPNSRLDVSGALSISGNAIISMPSSNPEVGPWNPIWNSIGSTKPLYFDEEFAIGNNGISAYNNSGGTGVVITRLTGQTGIPNSTGATLKISYDGVGATSPGFGGFILSFSPAANRTYVQRFRAKLPVGKTLVLAENPQGTNNTSYWLTNTAGTGKWEDYMRVSHAGNTGSFSSGGHVYVTGGSGAFDWYLASANVYEVNTPIIASANTWIAEQTLSGGAKFPGSGIWNASGNVGVATATPAYALDVNGSPRFKNWAYGLTPSSTDLPALTTVEYVNGMFSSTTVGAWTKSGNNIFNNNTGNVGIGTNNPTAPLVIYSNGSTIAPRIQFSKAGSYIWEAGVESDTPQMGSSYSNFVIYDKSATSPRLTITHTSGNVGIGTTSPAYKLQIASVGTFGIDTSASTVKLLSTDNNQVTLQGYALNFNTNGANQRMVINATGNVGIGTTTPAEKLDVYGNIRYLAGASNGGLYGYNSTGIMLSSFTRQDAIVAAGDLAIGAYRGIGFKSFVSAVPTAYEMYLTNGSLGIATNSPAYSLDVNGTARFKNWAYGLTPGSNMLSALTTVEYVNGLLASSSGSGVFSNDINLSGNNILNVNKLTVATIDPLYQINGTNYSSFAASIVGGVKEEYSGRTKLTSLVKTSSGSWEYEKVFDFNQLEVGSDLWVWRQTVDFSEDNIEVITTPSGAPADIYYIIKNNQLIFRSDRLVSISFRLTGRRFDWRSWPTKAHDQKEKPSFILNLK